jgi:hypothetical protein
MKLKKWLKHQKKMKKILIKNTTRANSKRTVKNRADGGPITRSKNKRD